MGLELYMCLRNGGPLCQENSAMVFEREEDAFDVLAQEGSTESIVAKIDTAVISKTLRRGGIEEIFYVPDDRGPGLLTLDDFDHAYNPTPEQQAEIIQREKEAIVRRMMMQLAAEGKVEWDLDTDTYRTIPPEEEEERDVRS